ncbi:MAG: bifunctional pyr operon transcriptional regulator/uracil phosphoribosyltransferase PyrR [Candidatus Methylomirabilis sp.]|nr:bifunctional pyr operon transcriptional regulator/uracil phosphoribosyltransferase PyrR [Deltaproteobacteria bacterium]
MRKVLAADEIRRSLTRIAHEIVERNKGVGGVCLIGVRTRGAPMAERIQASLLRIEDAKVPVGTIDITLYRDDICRGAARHEMHPSSIPFSIDDKTVVLVDDVLYTGRSTRAAMDALMDFGRPRRIQLAVLVDRGHRELPIRADYVGKNIPTHADQKVRVRLEEIDGADEVLVLEPGEADKTAEGAA